MSCALGSRINTHECNASSKLAVNVVGVLLDIRTRLGANNEGRVNRRLLQHKSILQLLAVNARLRIRSERAWWWCNMVLEEHIVPRQLPLNLRSRFEKSIGHTCELRHQFHGRLHIA